MATGEQIKAARALLRMEQEELARRAGVSVTTIRGLEAASGEYPVAEATAGEVQMALQAAGIDGLRRTGGKPDPSLPKDLRAIAKESARLQATLPGWTEEDLYDDRGMPA